MPIATNTTSSSNHHHQQQQASSAAAGQLVVVVMVVVVRMEVGGLWYLIPSTWFPSDASAKGYIDAHHRHHHNQQQQQPLSPRPPATSFCCCLSASQLVVVVVVVVGGGRTCGSPPKTGTCHNRVPGIFLTVFPPYCSATKNDFFVEDSAHYCCMYCSIPKRRVRTVLIADSMHKPPQSCLVVYRCIAQACYYGFEWAQSVQIPTGVLYGGDRSRSPA